ncbi:hypothetical protein O181_070819 [Austropuccinia psidii MF-1]|uniref:Tf2-1-like SH3-like domain-containing protein n=1 Tax=Austropuccinia psidii MF-1 TaxID=1389203 RepID=A0A9Q3F1L5_9BASI|nr:hypothetical protein [Austropuccinia psidii MF-1]
MLRTTLSFSTAYHSQTDGLAERMIPTLEYMIIRFCAYGLELKDSDGFAHDWCTLIPALELAYKTSVHSSTAPTPATLKKGWKPRIAAGTLRKDLVYIHSTAYSFKMILDRVKQHSKQIMNDTFEYSKNKWDKIHKVPDFKIGDLVLDSILTFNNFKVPKKLKYLYIGPFAIFSLHGTNAVQVELSGELENKHSTFPVSLIKPYQSADKELLPLWNPTPLTVPSVEQIEDQKIVKVIKKGDLGVKIKEDILSDIEIQYMNMNGWQNRKYLTPISF